MAGESISRFFDRLGFPLRNERNSWGAVNGEAVLLRTWLDGFDAKARRVIVLSNTGRQGGTTSAGLNERKAHLRSLWSGGRPAYTVIVTPVDDKTDGVRKIGDFRSDAVFPILQLVEDQGVIYGSLGAPIPVDHLSAHMQTHRVQANPGAMPANLADTLPPEPTDPAEKIDYKAAAVREYLIDAAKRRSKVLYGELFDAFDLNRLSVAHVLSRVGHTCLSNEEPILTALVVLKDTGRCSTGMDREFGVDEDEERERVFAHWAPQPMQIANRDGEEWSDDELRASVQAYREMQQLDASGIPFVKAEYYRQLSQRFARAEGAFERRMQNISSLLDARGLPWLAGLKPQANVGQNVEARLAPFLTELFAELTPPIRFAEEVDENGTVVEGAKRQIVVNAYERDPSAKPRCLKKWGCSCVVCGFNFEAAYGELGKGFIHVHHLKPLHAIGEAYELDPVEDLRPVCPNCHAMLHRNRQVLSIDELKATLRRTAA